MAILLHSVAFFVLNAFFKALPAPQAVKNYVTGFLKRSLNKEI